MLYYYSNIEFVNLHAAADLTVLISWTAALDDDHKTLQAAIVVARCWVDVTRARGKVLAVQR